MPLPKDSQMPFRSFRFWTPAFIATAMLLHACGDAGKDSETNAVLPAAADAVELSGVKKALPKAEDSDGTSKAKTVVLETFDGQDVLAKWSKGSFASIVPAHDGKPCLKVEVPRDSKEAHNKAALKLDPETVRGCKLVIEADVKAEGVSKPSRPWNGLKLMFHSDGGADGPLWKNPNKLQGTFDWRKEAFVVRVPADITEAEICLGLEACVGTAYFDNLKVTAFKRPPQRRAAASGGAPAFKGHALPRLRGMMSPNEFKEEDFKDLASWGANLIRWQLKDMRGQKLQEASLAESLARYDAWLEAKLKELDKVLDAGEKYGVMVVVDLHTGPGGRKPNNENVLFFDKRCQDKFVETWRTLAARCKGRKAVWGYDLLNEPQLSSPVPEGLMDWQGLAQRAAEEIRKIDLATPIIMESEEMDGPGAFSWLEPLSVPNVIYEVHMYVPMQFTQQMANGKKPVAYPGAIDGKLYDKEALKRALAPVVEFQRQCGAHIYVGEFSAIRWAPGAARYLSDVIEIFEEYGWDWTYHAFREWDGWSVEHEGARGEGKLASKDTDRKEALMRWFSKNVKPGFGGAIRASSEE